MGKTVKVKKDLNHNCIIIQKRWREVRKYKTTIEKELGLFNKILKDILDRLNESYRLNIVSVNEYKKMMTIHR